MPITIDYVQPPAIVRRHKESTSPEGEYGRWLNDCIANISENLDRSQKWKEIRDESQLLEQAEETDELNVFQLNRMPPKRTFIAQAKFQYIGRGKPKSYKLDDDE
jgi:hypothetical protein